ncbi:MAG: hypothetical protein H6744_12880 [Deltaproteobacteria bacterium]|nr:hypothetical protein [Deltaproteobacteria bacterium]MCB9787568.1 hypothetical protein [Deltaproteobacteria bacterium]
MADEDPPPAARPEPAGAERRLTELGALTRQLIYRLNNPLTVLRSQLAFLQECVEAGEATGRLAAEGPERLAALSDSLEDTLSVVGSLSQYVRGDGEPGEVDLVDCALIAYAVASVKLRYAAQLDLQGPDAPALVWGVAERLQQLLVGVFLHIGGREASYGPIEVRVRSPAPDRVQVVVSDVRASDGTTMRLDDEGLDLRAGLAIAEHIAREHGGTLESVSDPAGRATHTLELPTRPRS